MTATIQFDPDAPRQAVEAKATLLKILPHAHCAIISLWIAEGAEINVALVLGGEALDKIREVLIEEALKSHARAEQLLAEYEQQEPRPLS